MLEPNFSEVQLQQMTNTEIFNRLRGISSPTPIPIVIPQHYEDLWGWDTGIYIPWMGSRMMSQHGCNLFIQFKLSVRYNTNRAIGWDDWRSAFLRFDMGYREDRGWDFTQRNHLIDLSSKGFPVVYVTNHVLDFKQLISIALADQLCSTLPVLLISSNLANHKQISFTPTSTHFCLHSENEKAERSSINNILGQLKASDLATDLELLKSVIKRFEESVGIVEKTFQQLYESSQIKDLPYAKVRLIRWFLMRYFNLIWLRVERSKEEIEQSKKLKDR